MAGVFTVFSELSVDGQTLAFAIRNMLGKRHWFQALDDRPFSVFQILSARRDAGCGFTENTPLGKISIG